ncbi:phage integrase N-terminal SAM-like domain-containing protein [Candidatus Spongiihabitans sp.]|uniref:phage integrase N-terminal SAM-like domain-containing protein n=1 Tax=Candidatus Spongiihabitans sp. TaxID=3101308 RepID=UPI003C6F9660
MTIITKNKTLLQKMRETLRWQGYVYATENIYCDWTAKFIKFHGLKNREALLSFATTNNH